MELDELLHLLKENDLLDRLTAVRVGNISFSLGTNHQVSPHPTHSDDRSEEERMEDTLFASSG